MLEVYDSLKGTNSIPISTDTPETPLAVLNHMI